MLRADQAFSNDARESLHPSRRDATRAGHQRVAVENRCDDALTGRNVAC